MLSCRNLFSALGSQAPGYGTQLLLMAVVKKAHQVSCSGVPNFLTVTLYPHTYLLRVSNAIEAGFITLKTTVINCSVTILPEVYFL